MTEQWPETKFNCSGGGGCVLVEHKAGVVIIRDSKQPYQAGLIFSPREYADFRRRVMDKDSWLRLFLRVVKSAMEFLFG